MAVNNINITQGTQTAILTDNTGGTGGTLIGVVKLSTDAAGTFSTIWNGNVGVSSGTVTSLPNIPGGTLGSVVGIGSVSGLSNLPGGTVNLVSAIGTIGTLGLGSVVVNTLPNIPGGTLGSIVGIGAIPNIPGGTVNLGTVVGKDANAAAQSANPISIGGTDSGGTVHTIKVDSGGLQRIGLDSGTVSVLPNIPGGTLGSVVGVGAIPNIPGGTIGSVVGIGSVSGLSNLPQGSINVTAGTFREDPRVTKNIVTFGTQMAFSAGTQGTIVGSASVGAGTSTWINDFSIMNPNGTVLCVLSFGTTQQGTNVLFRGVLGTQTAVGIEKSYAKAVNAGMTNQDLVFSTGAAGTVDVSVSYFISA